MRKKKKGVHLQERLHSCGPAALKIALADLGLRVSERRLRELSQWNSAVGTEHAGMRSAARALGVYAVERTGTTMADLARLKRRKDCGVIVGWFSGRGDHYSVVARVSKHTLLFKDPGRGSMRRIARKDFPRIWFDFEGPDNHRAIWGWCLVISRERI